MTLSIKSALIQSRINKAIQAQQVEMPMQVFNRMCFGLVSNNWIIVISSLLKLTTFALMLAFSRSV